LALQTRLISDIMMVVRGRATPKAAQDFDGVTRAGIGADYIFALE
jgi:hypothetical protein